MKTSVHIIVSGRVQGVCFRYYCREQAMNLGVYGWVKNLENGFVEIIAEGNDDAMQKFTAWCGRGPETASITRCVTTPTPATGKFKSFDIRL